MQFNLVGIQAAQGEHQEGTRWLRELAEALTSRGKCVDWWNVSGEHLDAAPKLARASAEVATADVEPPSGVVERAVDAWQAASTMLQSHLLPELRREGEAVVVGQGWEVAPVLIALDQLLRAADVRYQVLLVWLAPPSLRALPQPRRGIDWERLKRACSIIALNPRVRQELIAERVGSLVIEQGAEGARWLAARSDRHSRGVGGGSDGRGAP